MNSRLIFCLSLVLLVSSCKKSLETDVSGPEKSASAVFSTDADATAAVTYLFYDMVAPSGMAQGYSGISALAGLSSDEFTSFATFPAYREFSANRITAINALNSNLWKKTYQNIYRANLIIENLKAATKLTPAVKNQLLGESKFVRAYLYFYIVNLYGDVPLILTSDYQQNQAASRTSKSEVYKQMISDLKDAQTLLPERYLSYRNLPTAERIRPNKGAATALLARAYLFSSDWSNAAGQALATINSADLYQLEGNLDQVFKFNSREAIWQLQPVNINNFTDDGQLFIQSDGFPLSTDSYRGVLISDALLAAFEPGDARSAKWVGLASFQGNKYYYPYKYKDNLISADLTEYVMLLRLAEQYLIYAEAEIQMGNTVTGIQALNTLRKRARTAISSTLQEPLPDLSLSLNKESALQAVYQERRVELFSEWGHRWLDLKRSGQVDKVMNAYTVKGGQWQAFKQLYPLPQTELTADPQLTQNPGY